MNINRIPHAVAYVKLFLKEPLDIGEQSVVECLINSQLSPVQAVSIIRETVVQHGIQGADVVLKEMNTPEFKQYVEALIS